jgi:hypothetical protein
MRWRPLRPGELDHERVWLFITLVCAFVAWVWLRSGVPTPKCWWHQFTGLPCIGCGSTRCVRYALHGAWTAAFLMNPLCFATLAGLVLYDLYAAVVLVFRLPRVRIEQCPTWVGWTVRLSVVALALTNWAWLIAHRV